MHVVIGGFGRVGRSLAYLLEAKGHSVAVIDRNRHAFDEIGPGFRGRRLSGEVFDRATLVKAGIERADAFAAVTSGDNSNIVSARIARERFDVPNVVARIFDPDRAVIYERFGIPTISSVQWSSAQLAAALLEPDVRMTSIYGGGEVVTFEALASPKMWGKRVTDVVALGKFTITTVVRDGIAILPHGRFELSKGDHLHITATAESIGELKELLGLTGGAS